MRKVTLKELEKLAFAAKHSLWAQARSIGRDVKLYLHWSAGHYGSFFTDYHINIDADGSIYLATENLAEVKAHTWRRNTGSIGITLACCAGAATNDLGAEPPTCLQIEAMAQVVSVLCQVLDLTIDKARVMTHAEAADEDGYGPGTTCERWDLAILKNGDTWLSGGEVIRGKAIWYCHQGTN